MESNDLPAVYYDQLIITKPMIPSDDLGINGDYGRHLIIPDDVLNTLSHLVTPQNGVPRIVTMHTDGGMNVHVVNQSSGGGGATPAAYKSFFCRGIQVNNATTNSPIITMDGITITYIVSVQVSVAFKNFSAGPSNTINGHVIFDSAHASVDVTSFCVPYDAAQLATALTYFQDRVHFNPPLDVAVFGGLPIKLIPATFGADGVWSATVVYA